MWVLIKFGPWCLLASVLVFRYLVGVSWQQVVITAPVVVLVLTALIYWMITWQWRNKKNRVDVFVTLTEAGVMYEAPALERCVYVAWQEVRKAQLSGAVLVVQLNSGITWFLPVESQPVAKRLEMCRYIQEHAGREVPEEKQVQPPACLRNETPYSGRSTLEQRREVADYVIMQQQGMVQWILLALIFFMMSVCPGLVLLSVLRGDWGFLVIGVCGMIVSFHASWGYLHPGIRLWKWVRPNEAQEVHISQESVMIVSCGKVWSVVPRKEVESAVKGRYANIYIIRDGGVFALGKEVVAPAMLPQPAAPRRRWIRLLIFALVLPLVCWCVQGAWLLSILEDDEVYDPGDELAAYVESLTPVQGYLGDLTYCSVYHLEEEQMSVLIAGWEDETAVEIIMKQPEERAAE
jgi:hypothetical protein